MRHIKLSIILFTLFALSFHASAQNSLVNAELVFTITDTVFGKPFIDIDEWRDVPVRHRYVHGGFKGTDTRFSFYFPGKEKYEGHFF
ncbi:hypothetical protein [Maribellus maritimus]|uniref:hypothetical protein n=1 Tax=Maribellus maritimus TaxID=2870838 RepID=UPI001EE9B167|nr:hypothetical protein [Maribellus maritimus]MCG6190362.1 hypothetical protein [Maribellus maritimus]